MASRELLRVVRVLLCGLCVAVLAAGCAGATSRRHVPEPDIQHGLLGRGWSLLGRVQDVRAAVHNSDELRLRVFLTHDPAFVRELERTFLEVSDPESASYGQHLSLEQVAQMVRVVDGAAEAVLSWLAENGIAGRVGGHGDTIEFEAPSATVEALLGVELYVFRSIHGGLAVRATRPYSVPARLAPFVDLVGELSRLPHLRAQRGSSTHADSIMEGGDWPNYCLGEVIGLQCGGWITPGVLKQRYRVDNDTVTNGAANNSIAVAEFDGEYYDSQDLITFSNACGVTPAISIKKVLGNQPNKPNVCEDGGCSEALLDIEYAAAMAPGVPMSFMYLDDYSILNWATNASALKELPLVWSISYGLDESTQGGVAYVTRANREFQKIGARGSTIVVASGDAGACGNSGSGNHLEPTFPASGDSVLAVGGTYFWANAIGEEAVTSWSGGGFSNIFARPSWQKSIVDKYLSAAHSLPPKGSFNASSRGYPDVAAICGSANPYCVLLSGTFQAAAGTSASAPVVAGIIASLNNARLNAGKPPLGFVNPLLYSLVARTDTQRGESPFNAVTRGSNPGGCDYGFPAASPWSAAAGLGTPNAAALKQLV